MFYELRCNWMVRKYPDLATNEGELFELSLPVAYVVVGLENLLSFDFLHVPLLNEVERLHLVGIL